MSTHGLDQWAALDEQQNAEDYVQYVEKLTADPFFRMIKQHTYRLMNVSPGANLLDVGCGAGDDVLEMAELVGETGFVAGIDYSQAMIDSATDKAKNSKRRGQLSFRQADCYQLPYADGTFDACRSDRVFQHLEHPERALSEMLRVLKPGGIIVITDPDQGSVTLDSSDQELTARIICTLGQAGLNPYSGRRLRGQFLKAGLSDVRIWPYTMLFHDLSLLRASVNMQQALNRLAMAGIITKEEGQSWWADQLEREQRGNTFFSSSFFVAAGRK